MVFGIAASQPVYFVMGISNLQKSIHISPPRKLIKKLREKLHFRLGLAYYITLSLIVMVVMITQSSGLNVLLVMASSALLALFTQLFLIYRSFQPASRFIHFRNLSALRKNRKNQSGQWLYYFYRYRVADLMGFLVLLSAEL